MGKKRLFVGIFIQNKDLSRNYIRIKKDFGGVLPGRWIKPENFHITLKFLGYVDPEKINDIKISLKGIIDNSFEDTIQLNGLGVFPDLYSPRILYINVKDPSGLLLRLNQLVEEKMSLLGFEKEKKPFRPHITIKRIKSKIDTDKFVSKLTKYKDFDFGKIQSLEVNLIESLTLPSGAIYSKI